ncbi:MAG: glycosyltransferase [Ferruginibacter sp.]
MTIAVNFVALFSDAPQNMKWYWWKIMTGMAYQQNGNRYIFIIQDKDALLEQYVPENIQLVKVQNKISNALSRYLWLQRKLPALLKAHQCQLVVHTDFTFIPRIDIQQTVVLDVLPNQAPATWRSKKANTYFKKYSQQILAQAKVIFTASSDVALQLESILNPQAQQLMLIPLLIEQGTQILNWHQLQDVKTTYTGTYEYFLYAGSIGANSNLINLLKAFSLFKIRQRSNMKLVVLADEEAYDTQFETQLETYKYRSDIVLLKDIPDHKTAPIYAAAYAFVYPVLYCNYPYYALKAMRAGLPVICSNTGALEAISDDLVLKANVAMPEDLAQKMMWLFKDETTRTTFIDTATPWIENCTPETAINLISSKLLIGYNQ